MVSSPWGSDRGSFRLCSALDSGFWRRNLRFLCRTSVSSVSFVVRGPVLVGFSVLGAGFEFVMFSSGFWLDAWLGF